ncbi:hypothetical protein BASA81_003038 [Batrachochytrium salamandrivorans]|nr:hypothetical protein BASA81_003038 [Batrachochytrium salamandrivorans]
MDRCGVCSLELNGADEASLLAHALEHSVQRKCLEAALFPCSECKRDFSLRTSLFAHLREVHPDNGGVRSASKSKKRNLVVPGLGDSLSQFAFKQGRHTICLECNEVEVRADLLVMCKHLAKPEECPCRRTRQEWEQLAVFHRQAEINVAKRATFKAMEEDLAKPETEYLLASTLLLMETNLARDSPANALAISKMANEVYNLIESYGLNSSDVDSLFKV